MVDTKQFIRRREYEKMVYCIHGSSFHGHSVKPLYPSGCQPGLSSNFNKPLLKNGFV